MVSSTDETGSLPDQVPIRRQTQTIQNGLSGPLPVNPRTYQYSVLEALCHSLLKDSLTPEPVQVDTAVGLPVGHPGSAQGNAEVFSMLLHIAPH